MRRAGHPLPRRMIFGVAIRLRHWPATCRSEKEEPPPFDARVIPAMFRPSDVRGTCRKIRMIRQQPSPLVLSELRLAWQDAWSSRRPFPGRKAERLSDSSAGVASGSRASRLLLRRRQLSASTLAKWWCNPSLRRRLIWRVRLLWTTHGVKVSGARYDRKCDERRRSRRHETRNR